MFSQNGSFTSKKITRWGCFELFISYFFNMNIILLFLTFLLPLGALASSKWVHRAQTIMHRTTSIRTRWRAVDGYVLFWDMGDLFGPVGEGIIAIKSYNKADCEKFLIKTIKTSFHKKRMAADNVIAMDATNNKWKKPANKSASAKIFLNFVCRHPQIQLKFV